MSSMYNRRVLVIFNPKSGIWFNITDLFGALSSSWDSEGVNLYYQESKSLDDGKEKARIAVKDGVDTVIAVGGDGMVNSIGSELIGTGVALAVIPTGSGNGFARHFQIPRRPTEAAIALRDGMRTKIDVGYVGDVPFLVTASLAWDAELVKGMQNTPIRGVLPYLFSGIAYYFRYTPQDFDIELEGTTLTIEKPLVLTFANLTQFGVGAKIAPSAVADDGQLTMVAVPQMLPHEILQKVRHLFDGTLYTVPEISFRNFTTLHIRRERPDPIQVDGELVEMGREMTIKVLSRGLDVIVPKEFTVTPSGNLLPDILSDGI